KADRAHVGDQQSVGSLARKLHHQVAAAREIDWQVPSRHVVELHSAGAEASAGMIDLTAGQQRAQYGDGVTHRKQRLLCAKAHLFGRSHDADAYTDASAAA